MSSEHPLLHILVDGTFFRLFLLFAEEARHKAPALCLVVVFKNKMLIYINKMPKGCAAVYDLTLSQANHPSSNDILKKLDKFCKRACMTPETGTETGFRHWQIRLCLRQSTTLKQCIALHQNVGLEGHLSVTSANNRRGQAFYSYIDKEDFSRTGPTLRLDEWRTQAQKYLKKHLRGKWDTRRAFQKTIHKMMSEWDGVDNRSIDMLADYRDGPDGRGGCIGKGILVGLAKHYLNAIQIPSTLQSGADVLQYAYSLLSERNIRENVVFMIDMPRKQNQEHLDKFFAALEVLKDGFCYDQRHKGREWDFDTPMIWIFGNNEPNLATYSCRRLRVWEVDRRDWTLHSWCALQSASSVDRNPPNPPKRSRRKRGRKKPITVDPGQQKLEYPPIFPISQKGLIKKGVDIITERTLDSTPSTSDTSDIDIGPDDAANIHTGRRREQGGQGEARPTGRLPSPVNVVAPCVRPDTVVPISSLKRTPWPTSPSLCYKIGEVY